MTSSPHSLPVRRGGDTHARDAWVEIDLNKLEANLQTIKTYLREQAKQAGIAEPLIMGVVKADAYGHGAVVVAQVLAACGIPWLGVASADEGQQLRQAYCKLPILILGPTPSWAVKNALQQRLDLTISSLPQLQEIIDVLEKDKYVVPVHLKVDTGMHRLGMNKEDASKAIALLKANKKFKLVSVFSHLAKASVEDTSSWQKQNFDDFIQIFKIENYQPQFLHLASSHGAKHFPFTYYDMVRIGLHMYGLESRSASPELIPIMAVRGRINQINKINKGEAVGYGLTWKSDRPAYIANIPIGYADGVDRGLSNKMQGLLHNKLIKQVGTISMDQMLFDITDVPQAKEGDVITLIGSDDFAARTNAQGSEQKAEQTCLYLADWACQLDTITYEIACRLKARLPRIYTRNQINERLHKSSFATAEKGK